MIKQWAEKYLKEAIKDEIELARVKLLRKALMPTSLSMSVDLIPAPKAGLGMNLGAARQASNPPLPKWRRDWRAAGPLVGELGLSVRTDDEEGTVSVGNGNRRRDITEAYQDHPDKDAAICAAIVRAAIRICTEAREQC